MQSVSIHSTTWGQNLVVYTGMNSQVEITQELWIGL